MGCTSVKPDPPSIPDQSTVSKSVDPRLPFDNYRELYRLRNSWKAVSRAMENTAKLNLMRFFRNNPDFQNMFENFNLQNLNDEELMFSDVVFETHAVAVFNTFDEVFANVENVDVAIKALHQAGMMHTKIQNFKPEYFEWWV
ncbi:cytoglobin-1-like isoform X2 [Lineus longissimus]|uniref:cytoglobin-1-like isoform X2 n=1 Tax=Lineus longissimus TaxID=88925 RepID=UPI002B4E4822